MKRITMLRPFVVSVVESIRMAVRTPPSLRIKLRRARHLAIVPIAPSGRTDRGLMFFITIFFLNPTHIHTFKIDRVILATDTHPTYIEFWPIVAKAWKSIGIQPTLALIAPADVIIDETLGDVMRFDPIDGIPTSLQAQCIRLLLPALFPNDFSIISDIDMIPLQRHYFTTSTTNCPDDAFVVFKAPVSQRFPMCYNAARGTTFQDLFNIHTIHDIKQTMIAWNKLGLGWNTDELVLYQYLTQWKFFTTRCIQLGHDVHPRIDRMFWHYDKQLLKQGYYIDAHCLRPYTRYKHEIDQLLHDMQ